jgi:hypothetical protein
MVNYTLYEDKHPKTSLKGTGYKDAKKARQTIKLVSKYDLTYQFQVINTMYNRAKHHPFQTKDMKEAMKVFKKWLSRYKS